MEAAGIPLLHRGYGVTQLREKFATRASRLKHLDEGGLRDIDPCLVNCNTGLFTHHYDHQE